MSVAALAVAALLAAGADAGTAPPDAQAADSALATAERSLAEARGAGAAEADLSASAELLSRARAARRAQRLGEARRLSDEAWELARRAREAAAGRTRFGVAVGEGDETRIAVRRGGPVEVEAGPERASVPAGQGARVRAGTRLEVGPLPGAPSLLAPPDGAAVMLRPAPDRAEPVLSWSPVPSAASYEVSLSRDAEGKEVALRLTAAAARVPLRGELPPGEYRWRVTAFDGRGLPGPPSSWRRLLVTERPPRLEVDRPVWR